MKTLRFTCSFFVFIVGVGVVIAQSNPPAPSKGQEASSPPKKVSEPDKAQTNAITQPVDPISREQIAPDHDKYERDDKSPWKDPITWFTGGLLIVAAFQAWIYWEQKRLMEKALNETRRAADAATESANSYKRVTELTERAELQIVGFSLPPINRFTRVAKFEMRYQNFGRTIATDVIANVRFHEIPNATHASTSSVMAAGGENLFSANIDEIHGHIPDERLNAFENGTEQLRLVVELSFTDIFGLRTKLVYDVLWDSRDRAFKFSVTGRDSQKTA